MTFEIIEGTAREHSNDLRGLVPRELSGIINVDIVSLPLFSMISIF